VKDSTRTQSFTYDPLNRLLSAGDNGHWANTYTYDAWGNLTNKTPGAPAGENLNKTADTNNHLSGLTYDAAGNVINDGLGGAFVFDGENRIKTASSVTYTYDAVGRRIQKSTGVNYWYGPQGAALAETDSTGAWTNYIFFGGRRLARNVNGDIKYYITDHLHSTAMFVDKAGTTAAILDDNDMYPWGGVIPGVGKTTSNNTIKFTGQYRDIDTGTNLDYFGARYYSNTIGRFMSPDWAGAPTSVPYARFGDPQSLNLYSYTENGPINRMDADGHMIVGFTGNGIFGVRGTGVNDGTGGLGLPPAAQNVAAVSGDIDGKIELTKPPGCGGGDPHNCGYSSSSDSTNHWTQTQTISGDSQSDWHVTGDDGKDHTVDMKCSGGQCTNRGGDGGVGEGSGGGNGGGSGSGLGRDNSDVAINMDIFHCAGCAKTWHSASNTADALFVATGAVIVGVPAAGELVTTEGAEVLFARGANGVRGGLLNSNNYLRIGWSWSGGAAWGVMNTMGQEVFRISIGNVHVFPWYSNWNWNW
jgi:RHS repeat-associated protein